MAKEDLLAEAERLGIEGLDDSFTNKQIQKVIDEAKAAEETVDEPAVAEDEPEAEAVEVEAPVASEPVFEIRQFAPHAESLFGVGYHVLVGAQSAGCFPSGKITRDQARAGIERYLNMPIEQGKEG
jgi:hypothetical protein